MKAVTKVLILIVLTSAGFNCNSIDRKASDQSASDTLGQQPTKIDSAYLDKVEVADTDKEFADHRISFYLSNPQIPQICKDLYSKKRLPTDDSDVLASMDSIFTTNNETRPFYFLTLTRAMDRADGAYAEPLGLMTGEFVETRTKDFLNYFVLEPMLTSHDFGEWAKMVAGEIGISAEHHENDEADNLRMKMKTNCSECSSDEKQKIEDFVIQVKDSIKSNLQSTYQH